jgi:hypothetical protein
MLFRSPTAKTPWAQPPPSSRGPGRCPFKAVTRVRIPLGARTAWSCGAAWSARHPVKVEVAGSNPVRTAPGRTLVVRPRAGSSVGTSVRLKIGRSAVRPRPCPPAKMALTCTFAGSDWGFGRAPSGVAARPTPQGRSQPPDRPVGNCQKAGQPRCVRASGSLNGWPPAGGAEIILNGWTVVSVDHASAGCVPAVPGVGVSR